MDELIAYCGLPCHTCPILLATRESDIAKKLDMRIQIAQQIEQHYGKKRRPEDITDCDGCRTEGARLYSGCGHCLIRSCARERGIESCAYCNEYACEKLEEFFIKDPQAKERLEHIRKQEK